MGKPTFDLYNFGDARAQRGSPNMFLQKDWGLDDGDVFKLIEITKKVFVPESIGNKS